jgi:hypothetical protein
LPPDLEDVARARGALEGWERDGCAWPGGLVAL